MEQDCNINKYKMRSISMKINIILKKDNSEEKNTIEKKFNKILNRGFSEKSSISLVAKAALNSSVDKGYSVKISKADSTVVDFRKINEKILSKKKKKKSLENLPKGVRVIE